MSKPVFVATHPRACSTAFERVFMTRRDTLQCVHEPFGDAYYFGPERLAERYEPDKDARESSGFGQSTYKTIMDRINKENTEGKRIFIKDMAQYFIPPNSRPVSMAPSLLHPRRGVGTQDSPKTGATGSKFHTTASVSDEDAVQVQNAPYNTIAEINNPTVVPRELLGQFHFAFLIRHPARSIPSYFRCCVPPLDSMTGFHQFRPDEAGYVELVRLFDYLKLAGLVGPGRAKGTTENGNVNGHTNGVNHEAVDICVVDADDLLDKPQEVVESFCRSVGIDFNASMLNWDSEEEHEIARNAFEKWKGFHEDAINSKDLKPRDHRQRVKSGEPSYDDWLVKFGKDGADLIQKTVDENVEHYQYLKQFAVRV